MKNIITSNHSKKASKFLFYLIFIAGIFISCKSEEEELREKEEKEVERLMKKEDEDSIKAANIDPNSDFDYNKNYYDEDYHRYLKYGTLIKCEGAGTKYSNGVYSYYILSIKRINGSIAIRESMNNYSRIGERHLISPRKYKSEKN